MTSEEAFYDIGLDVENDDSDTKKTNQSSTTKENSTKEADLYFEVDENGKIQDQNEQEKGNGNADSCEKKQTAKTATAFILWLLARIMFLNTKKHWFNATWFFFMLVIIPALCAFIIFVLIPMPDAYEDHEKLIWVLITNPLIIGLFSYCSIHVFFYSLDIHNPWRPLQSYIAILVVGYAVQVLCPGLVVYFYEPFEALGVVAVAAATLVILLGLYFTPWRWLCQDREHYKKTFISYSVVMVLFVFYFCYLMVYILVYSAWTDGQVLWILITEFVTWIVKKLMLKFTVDFPIDVSMMIAGLWIQNMKDLFFTMAYPHTQEPAKVFPIIWVFSCLGHLVYLFFMTNPWFKFRLWWKSKFKGILLEPIEEDLDPDDRGRSNQHPGYRRRQYRYIIWRYLSTVESNLVFLVVCPMLRYTWNQEYFPYLKDRDEEVLDDWHIHNDNAKDTLDDRGFKVAMIFAAATVVSIIVIWPVVQKIMKMKWPEVLEQVRQRYQNTMLAEPTYLGLLIGLMISNLLLAVAAISVPYRMYFF